MRKILILLFWITTCVFINGFTVPTCTSDDSVPDPESCESYYICLDGNPIHMSCPSGLIFDPNTNMCDFAENVTCYNFVRKTYSLINPSTSSMNLNVSGGQRMDCKAKNDNILGVTLNWTNEFVSSSNIFTGILLPTASVKFTDGIFGNIPVMYRHKAVTASDAALITFIYDTNM